MSDGPSRISKIFGSRRLKGIPDIRTFFRTTEQSVFFNGALTLLGSTPVAAAGGVGAFAVNGGNLSELGTSPFALPAGATPGHRGQLDHARRTGAAIRSPAAPVRRRATA